MTTSMAINKILTAVNVQQLREATAQAINALSKEKQLEERITALELKVQDMEDKT